MGPKYAFHPKIVGDFVLIFTKKKTRDKKSRLHVLPRK